MFPGRSTFFIFYDQNRPANGSPFGGGGGKRVGGGRDADRKDTL